MFYRFKQVWWALSAQPLNSEDRRLVDELLSSAEKELFYRFSVNDQNHSIRVVKYNIGKNLKNRSLLKASLLHDIGKTKAGRLSILDRSVAVAIKAVLPSLSQSWGKRELEEASRFQRPSIVRAQHAEWGAEMVKAAGGDHLTVSLIRRHQDMLNKPKTEEERLLAKLQIADDLC